MVSFSCEACGDVLTKKKLDPHRNRCYGATFTCIDCMVHFPGTQYRSHTACMTEDQKYQGALYKAKKPKSTRPAAPSQPPFQPHKRRQDPAMMMPMHAYVEDYDEGYDGYEDYEAYGNYADDGMSPAEMLPEAPTPPSAADNLNVFDFLVDATPNASTLHLPTSYPEAQSQNIDFVQYDQEPNTYVDQADYTLEHEGVDYADGSGYANESMPTVHYETPKPKSTRRKTKDGESKKDRKRKVLYVETNGPLAIENGPGDIDMMDAPPEAHSGLTGGLNRLMRPSQFPPSPDYSGDTGNNFPSSPIKKSKPRYSKSSRPKRPETLGGNLMALIAKPPKTKVSKKGPHSLKDKKRRHHKSDEKAPKRIGFRPGTADEDGAGGQMVVYKPRSELFLGMCTKGPDSERGCSMNKALKRFHRERASSGTSTDKAADEKELWRSLRMRRNDRGEVVLFSISPEEANKAQAMKAITF